MLIFLYGKYEGRESRMKKTLKIIGLIFLSLFIIVEIAFVLILPNVINLANYKDDIQTLVKEQAKLDVDYRNAKLVTTPLFWSWSKIEGCNNKAS